MKYRKKPVIVEAIQMTEEARWRYEKWPSWLVEASQKDRSEEGSVWVIGRFPKENRDKLVIHTLEGMMVVDWGDWIIKGTRGELYPCKPDVFADCYEGVAE